MDKRLPENKGPEFTLYSALLVFRVNGTILFMLSYSERVMPRK
jgi:hypothetical protein